MFKLSLSKDYYPFTVNTETVFNTKITHAFGRAGTGAVFFGL